MRRIDRRDRPDQEPADDPRPGRSARWIDDRRGFDEMLEHLVREPLVAADTEADSFYAYKVKICLFQFSVPGQDYLVDPLAGLDLAPLGRVFEDPRIEVIFHAAENDVGLLGYLHGFRFRNLFDTMLAAQVLGYRHCGLAPLLAELFGLEIPKRLQTSDWRQRPLTPAQIDYACMDTRHLLALRARFLGELREKGRLEEATSEFQRLEQCLWEPRPFDPDGFARIRGAGQLDPMERRLLKEFYCCRDRLARRADRAPYRVFTDAELLRLVRAAAAPGSTDRDGLPLKGWKAERYGNALRAALRQARARGPISKMPRPRARRPARSFGEMTADAKRLFEALRHWRLAAAEDRGVIPSRVATTRMLAEMAHMMPRDLEDLARVQEMAPWRLAEFGRAILDLVAAVRDRSDDPASGDDSGDDLTRAGHHSEGTEGGEERPGDDPD